jgi:hypothetical protein
MQLLKAEGKCSFKNKETMPEVHISEEAAGRILEFQMRSWLLNTKKERQSDA